MKRREHKRSRITKQIRDAILASGMSQADVASYTGMAPSTLSRFLAGKREPHIHFIESVCDLLGLSLVNNRKANLKTATASARRKRVKAGRP